MKMKTSILLICLLLSGCGNLNSNSTLGSSTSFNSNISDISSSTCSTTSFNNSSDIFSSEDYLSGSSNISVNIDPYINMTRSEFYSNYKEATSYEDAMYRTKHGFISGSIDIYDEQTEKNTIYIDEDFVKFSNYSYGYNENNEIISYDINTVDGVYKTIYYNAGYVAIDDVAAYIFAFGDVPPNSKYSKNSRDESIEDWGRYGRVNISNYSNDTSRWPNEPELPTHDSNGKAYQYIETDIGIEGYNNGYSISRGSCRIVYTGKYKDGTKVNDINERHVFYTYNHYEDFEEYLNYYGGWGDRFGYEMSGETTPTPYIEALIIDKNTFN